MLKEKISKKKLLLLMTGILLLGAILRLWGIDFGLPYFTHSDESHYLPKAVGMLARLNPNPGYFHNPPLLTYIYAFAVGIHYIFLQLLGLFIDLPTFKELWQNNPASIYMVARVISAVFGVGTCFLVFHVGKKLFNTYAGLVSAALLCVSFIHVRDSHYAVNDITAAFFIVLAFNFIVDIWKKGTFESYVTAGIVSGLAVAVKYNAGLIVIPFIAAFFLGQAHSRRKERKHFFTYFLSAFAGFFIVCPWIILDMKRFWDGFLSQLQMAGSPWLGGAFESSYSQFLKTLLWGYGLLPLLLFAFGCILLLKQKHLLLLLAGFPLVYTILLGSSKLFFVRFTLPVVPFLCIFSGYAIFYTAEFFAGKHGGKVILLLTILSLLQGFIFSVRHNVLLGRTDTRVTAGYWMLQNIPTGSKIAIENYCPDISGWTFIDRRINEKYAVTDTWRYLSEKNLADYAKEGYHYIVTSDFIRKRYLSNPEKYSGQSMFYNALDREAEKIYSSAACKRGIPFFLDEVYSPFRNIFVLNEPGPCINIYRVSGAGKEL